MRLQEELEEAEANLEALQKDKNAYVTAMEKITLQKTKTLALGRKDSKPLSA